MNYEGIMTALITPFTKDKEIDREKLIKLIEFQIDKGVHSLLVLGGTGEYTSLSNQQKKEVIDISIKTVKNRVPIIVGTIDPGIGNTLEIGLYAKNAGADALMIVTPYYANPTQEGIIEYYQKLDKEINLPIFLYNIPHKTGVNMLPKTVNSIINNTNNIVGIKECTEDFSQMVELINLVGEKIKVLAGEEFVSVAAMIFGAKGAVMASANIIPDVWLEIYDLIKNNNIKKAIEKNKEYQSVFNSIFMESNPGPLKALLEINELSGNNVNLPLLNISERTKKVLNEIEL